MNPFPIPSFKGTESGSADASYWVDQFNTFGLGKNIPIATGNLSDSLLALLPNTGSSSRCAFRIPWDSLRRVSTGGLMIRMWSGRETGRSISKAGGHDEQGGEVPVTA